MKPHLIVAIGIGMLAVAADAQLVANWQANGNAADSSGNGHNGTTVGPVVYGPGIAGGQSFELSGGDYVSVPASSAWGFGGSAFSINVWADFFTFNRDGGPGQLGHTFVGQDAGGGYTNKWVFFQSGSNLWFHINGPGAGGSQFLASPDSIPLVRNTWSMFTITRSGTAYSFYDDGVYLGTDTSTLSVPFSGTPLTLGQAEGIGWFQGALTDVSIYDNALSAAQIRGLYASGTSSTPGPAALLPFGIGLLAAVRRRSR